MGLDGGAVLALGLLGREHEGLDEEGDDLADVDLGVHGVVALLPVEVALGLAEGVEADGAGHVAVPHELEERLGVGVFHVGLAQLRLLVRRVRPSRDDAEDGDGEAGLAHALQLLGVARDAVVVDALEQDGLDVLARIGSGEALGGAGVLPVLNEVRHCGEFQIVSRLVKKLDGGFLISGRNKKKIEEANF